MLGIVVLAPPSKLGAASAFVGVLVSCAGQVIVEHVKGRNVGTLNAFLCDGGLVDDVVVSNSNAVGGDTIRINIRILSNGR